MTADGAVFLVAADRGYPKKLAFQYLAELAGEFGRLYGRAGVDGAARPYAFIKFGERGGRDSGVGVGVGVGGGVGEGGLGGGVLGWGGGGGRG